MIPFHIARSFDVLAALARGDAAALAPWSTPELAAAVASTVADPTWRRAGQAWTDAARRTVTGRTDGSRTFVRFHAEGDRALVLEYAGTALAGFRSMDAGEFEAFGRLV